MIRCEARGFPFDVCGDPEVHGTLTALFAALERPAGDSRAVFSVERHGGSGSPWDVRIDGQLVMGCELVGEAIHGLMVHLNQRVVMARDDLLSIHAAGVAMAGRALLLPGASGSGKTTLCAHLLQLGADYLSDDSVALDRQGRVLGYPKALGFKVGTWEYFREALADLDVDHGLQLVWQVPPARLGASSVTSADPVAVVIPRFEPEAPVRLEPLPRHTVAAELLTQAQNLLAFGASDALVVIGDLTAQVPCHAMTYGDAREAAPVVLHLIETASSGVAPYTVIPPESPGRTADQPVPVADVSALCFEDGVLLVRGESGEFATVDRVGALIWPLLDGHRTAESIAAELAPLFEAPRSEVESGVSGLIRDLAERGFVVRPSA